MIRGSLSAVRLLAGSAMVLAAGWSGSVQAQSTVGQGVPTQATSDPAASPGDPENAVSDIIVTAQRRNESLQNVPVSITPITGQDLASRKLADLSQLTIATPSLSIGSDNTFSIRGVGSQIFAGNVDSSVGVSVDEVSLGVPLFMSNGILDDIAQVEVLSGPQGLLFGKNASAGLLNVVSNRPRLGVTEGNVSLEYDNRDEAPGGHFGYYAKGTVNLPLGTDLAFRANFVSSLQDPVTENVKTPNPDTDSRQRRLAGKAKLLWDPSEGLSVYLIGDYSRERGIGAIFDRSFRSVAAGGVNVTLTALDGITAGPKNLFNAPEGLYKRSVNTGGVSLNAAYELGSNLTLSNIAAWRAYSLFLAVDTDQSSRDFLSSNTVDQNYNQYSDELRLALAPGGLIDGQVGLFYFHAKQNSDGQLSGRGEPLTGPGGVAGFVGGDTVYSQRWTSKAAFGQLNLHATDALNLIAGARVTRDDIAIDAVQNALPFVIGLFAPSPLPPGQRYETRQDFDNTNFSYRVGAQYTVSPTGMAYVTYTTGYKGPTFNQGASFVGQDLTVRPEKARNLEVGVKTELFDRRLRLNVSAFTSRFSDFQVQALVGNQFITQNAASVRARGVELSGSAKPVNRLTVNFGATLLDSRFRNFPGAACANSQIAAGECVNGAFNARGLRTPVSARFTSTLQGIYEFPLNDEDKLFLEGSYYHRSSTNFSATRSPLTRFGATDTLGGSIGLRLSDRWEFSVFCKNCTNQLVPSYINLDAGDNAIFHVDSSVQSFTYNSVRTIGATAKLNF